MHDTAAGEQRMGLTRERVRRSGARRSRAAYTHTREVSSTNTAQGEGTRGATLLGCWAAGLLGCWAAQDSRPFSQATAPPARVLPLAPSLGAACACGVVVVVAVVVVDVVEGWLRTRADA